MSGKTWRTRGLASFGLGVSVCLIYWLSGYIARDAWYTSSFGSAMVYAKGWVWPSATLDIMFRDTRPQFAIATLFAMNGLTYAAISLGLLAVRGQRAAYFAIVFGVLALVIWFNTAVLQTFSWLGLLLVAAGFIWLVFLDTRSSFK